MITTKSRRKQLFKPDREPAPGSSLVSARQAIYSLAQFAEGKDIREEALMEKPGPLTIFRRNEIQ